MKVVYENVCKYRKYSRHVSLNINSIAATITFAKQIYSPMLLTIGSVSHEEPTPGDAYFTGQSMRSFTASNPVDKRCPHE